MKIDIESSLIASSSYIHSLSLQWTVKTNHISHLNIRINIMVKRKIDLVNWNQTSEYLVSSKQFDHPKKDSHICRSFKIHRPEWTNSEDSAILKQMNHTAHLILTRFWKQIPLHAVQFGFNPLILKDPQLLSISWMMWNRATLLTMCLRSSPILQQISRRM